MYLNPVLIDDLHDLPAPLDLDDANLSGSIQLLENAQSWAVPSRWAGDYASPSIDGRKLDVRPATGRHR